MSGILAISPINPITGIKNPVPPSVVGTSQSGGFEAALEEAIFRVNQSQSEAKDSASRLLAGENEELHQVALATQRAEIEFELLLQVRNKAVQAYQEIMRMQL